MTQMLTQKVSYNGKSYSLVKGKFVIQFNRI